MLRAFVFSFVRPVLICYECGWRRNNLCYLWEGQSPAECVRLLADDIMMMMMMRQRYCVSVHSVRNSGVLLDSIVVKCQMRTSYTQCRPAGANVIYHERDRDGTPRISIFEFHSSPSGVISSNSFDTEYLPKTQKCMQPLHKKPYFK